jgi:hypothetical protein
MDFLLSSAKELVANGAAKLNKAINQAIRMLADMRLTRLPPIARAGPEFELPTRSR